jgi:PncC family amidohydrolase
MVQDASVLASILARRLKLAGLFISTAESCTGGMVASALTDIQGASKWFRQGWITYTNEAKNRQLGVPEELFDDGDDAAGAVSPEVAEAMAKGAAKESNCDVAIGVTGIAGPTGATETKEVGLVWVGIYIEGEVITKSAEFGQGDRHSNKEAFTTFALRVALEAWDKLRDDEEEILVVEEEEAKEPTIPEALKQLSNGEEKDEEWSEDVAWSEGEEEPKPEEPVIPESDIAWDDDE